MSSTLILCIALLTAIAVLFRPFRLPEYVFAVLGALGVLATGSFSVSAALQAVFGGLDVYLFLIGMMLLAEIARREGLFTYGAALATRLARGSSQRLFLILYGIGVLVTVFLSNDATAVVLTPAVYATARAAKVDPMPYLFACACIANAASFVLPISNPANLVIYASAMPPLATWLAMFLLPSIAAILATYVMLRFVFRHELASKHPCAIEVPRLGSAGKVAAWGICGTGALLLGAASLSWPLGALTLLAAITVLIWITISTRQSPAALLGHVSWGVVPLVAGLFVVVEAVFSTGAPDRAVEMLQLWSQMAPDRAALGVGGIFAIASNLINNLPVGLIAATASRAGDLPPEVIGAMLIGVDLGPNLSVTGSLATILWLVVLRREGLHVSAWQFLRVGIFVMPPALILALAAYILF